MASSIHFKSLGAQGKLRTHGVGRLHAGITILKTLKEMWQPLQPIVSPMIWCKNFANIVVKWTALETLFRSGRVDINKLSRSQSDAPDLSPDFEQITSHRVLPPDASGGANFYSFIEDQANSGGGPLRSASISHTTGPRNSPVPQASTIPRRQSEIKLPRHSTGEQQQRESLGSSNSSSRERLSQQPRQIPSQQGEVLPTRAVQNLTSPPLGGQSYQHYPPGQSNLPNYQQSMQSMRQGSEITASSPEVSIKPDLSSPDTLFPGRTGGGPSFSSQLTNGPDALTGFPMHMEGMGEGSDLWWDQSFDNMELDNFGFLIATVPPENRTDNNYPDEFYGMLGV